MSTNISAQFGEVAATSDEIRVAAQGVQSMLEDFKNEVAKFVAESWDEGAASEAFRTLQATWDAASVQLQTTLDGAAKLVNSGNSDLQSTDTALAGLF
ncbi:WXG100 family type VII secretion target [Nocardia fluminea]|uniref:WXG100 family type VII secretion target n=1 Tax=Nocardia fluminea TaxID=134984 RepID=UPI0034276F69